MSDFELVNFNIIDAEESNGILSIDINLRVKMLDYVVDKNKKVVRGSNKRKIDIEYAITYVRNLDKQNDITCPNCGAKIQNVINNECEYCKTLIVIPSNDFVMSRKKCIRQRR